MTVVSNKNIPSLYNIIIKACVTQYMEIQLQSKKVYANIFVSIAIGIDVFI